MRSQTQRFLRRMSTTTLRSTTLTKQNPLLNFTTLPKFNDLIPSKHCVSAVEQNLEEYKTKFQQVEASIQTETTASKIYESAINDLERASAPLTYSWGITNHLMGVKNSDDLRKAHETLQPKVVEEIQQQSQSQVVFQALQKCTEAPDYQDLDEAQHRIVTSFLRSMKNAGVGLPEKDRETFNELQKELATLSTTFQNNVLDSTNSFRLNFTDQEKLSGLPETTLALASSMHESEDSTPENGPWSLTLDMPLLLPSLQHLDDRDLREKLYRASRSIASKDPHNNTPLVTRMLEIRQKMAEMLGMDNFASLSLSSKMAPDVKSVTNLSEMLLSKSKPAAKKELLEVEKFAREQYKLSGQLELWDIPYYSEKLRERLYNYTDEDVRPYFSLPTVEDGMFRLASTLFGISIIEQDKDHRWEGWHKDVKFYHVLDNESNKHIASFYLDPYSRPGEKRGGAWMDQLFGKSRALHQDIPVAYLVCNGSPPDDRAGTPSLMTFRDVETLFHEFGHGLQHMLTEVEHGGAAGINLVEWDAVELPSQFMENFCYHKDTLLSFAKHYDTGEVLPMELFEKIVKAKNFQAGMGMTRQLFLGQLDLELHSTDINVNTPSDIQLKIANEYLIMKPLEDDFQLNSFLHIFAGGYSAGYYSYKWAELLSADAFGMFEEYGLENDNQVEMLGRKFRKTFLAQGGSRHPLEVFVDFRGREPDHEALLRHSGLLDEGDKGDVIKW